MPEKMDNIFWISYSIHELLAKAKNTERFETSTVVHLEMQDKLWGLHNNGLPLRYLGFAQYFYPTKKNKASNIYKLTQNTLFDGIKIQQVVEFSNKFLNF